MRQRVRFKLRSLFFVMTAASMVAAVGAPMWRSALRHGTLANDGCTEVSGAPTKEELDKLLRNIEEDEGMELLRRRLADPQREAVRRTE